MFRIWIKQVFQFLINLLWTEEVITDFKLQKNICLKYDWVFALYKYKDKNIRQLIWQLKFRSDRSVAVLFGQKIALEIVDLNLNNYILIPIPIHWRRKMERGFNQTEWICKEIVRANKNLKCIKILKRVVYSKKQSWNNKKDRQNNIKSVFKVKKKFENYILDKNILLIDDVVTTGATLNEARDEILKFKPKSVKAMTIAF